jgi:hypothetical protein
MPPALQFVRVAGAGGGDVDGVSAAMSDPLPVSGTTLIEPPY